MAQKKLNESSINNNSYLSEPRWIVREDGSKERHMIGYLQPKKEKGISQEDRKLLLKDLCARLPYHPILNWKFSNNTSKDDELKTLSDLDIWWITEAKDCEVKPYLRPIKSMTPEECDKLFKILDIREDSGEWLKINDIGVLRLFTENGKDFYEIAEAMDYLYSIHIDFRGLIEKSLAIVAPEGMYK